MSSISNQQLDFCFLVDVFLLYLFIGSLQVSSPLITKTLFHYYHYYENYQSSFGSCQVQSRDSFIHMNAVGKEKTNPKVFAGDLVRQWHEFSALLPLSVWGGTQNKAGSSFSFKPGSLTFVFLSVSLNMVLTQQRGWDVWQWMSTMAHWRTSVSLWEWNSAVTRGFLWSHLQNSSLSVWGPGQAPEVSWDPDSRKCHIWSHGWPFHSLESPKVFPHLLETLTQGLLIEFWCTPSSRNHTDNQTSDQYSTTTNPARQLRYSNPRFSLKSSSQSRFVYPCVIKGGQELLLEVVNNDASHNLTFETTTDLTRGHVNNSTLINGAFHEVRWTHIPFSSRIVLRKWIRLTLIDTISPGPTMKPFPDLCFPRGCLGFKEDLTVSWKCHV